MFGWFKAKPAKEIMSDYDAGFLYACQVALYGGADVGDYGADNLAFSSGAEEATELFRKILNYNGALCDVSLIGFVPQHPERIAQLQKIRDEAR